MPGGRPQHLPQLMRFFKDSFDLKGDTSVNSERSFFVRIQRFCDHQISRRLSIDLAVAQPCKVE